MSQTTQDSIKPRYPWRALWAAALSALAPGLGHVYSGAWRLGVSLIAVSISMVTAGKLLTSLAPLTPLTVIICMAGLITLVIFSVVVMIDAVRRSWRAEPRTRGKWYKSTLAVFVAQLVIVQSIVLSLPHGWRNYSVPSSSNEPTILIGDYIITEQPPTRAALMASQIIAFRRPGSTAVWLKRVVGLPGDIVQVTQGVVYINHHAVSRDFISDYTGQQANGVRTPAKRYRETLPGQKPHDIVKYSDDARFDATAGVDANNTEEVTVPPNTLYVLGDNRDDSMDSRFPSVGVIPIRNVLGVARVIYWSRDRQRIMTEIQ